MTFEMLKGKIHRATVVQAELDYVGIPGKIRYVFRTDDQWASDCPDAD